MIVTALRMICAGRILIDFFFFSGAGCAHFTEAVISFSTLIFLRFDKFVVDDGDRENDDKEHHAHGARIAVFRIVHRRFVQIIPRHHGYIAVARSAVRDSVLQCVALNPADQPHDQKVFELPFDEGKIDLDNTLKGRNTVEFRRFDDRFVDAVQSREVDEETRATHPRKTVKNDRCQHGVFGIEPPLRRYAEPADDRVHDPARRARKDDLTPQHDRHDAGDNGGQHIHKAEKRTHSLTFVVIDKLGKQKGADIADDHARQREKEHGAERTPEERIAEHPHEVIEPDKVRRRAVPVGKRMIKRVERRIVTENEKKHRRRQDPEQTFVTAFAERRTLFPAVRIFIPPLPTGCCRNCGVFLRFHILSFALRAH